MEIGLFNDQKGKRIGCCSIFVDPKWMKTINRKKAEGLTLKIACKKAQDEEEVRRRTEELEKEEMQNRLLLTTAK